MDLIVRTVVLLLVSMVIVNAADVLNNDEMEKVVKDCQKESGFKGSFLDIKTIDSSKDAKCFLKCVNDAKQALRKDGTIDAVLYNQYIENDPMMKPQPEFIEKLMKVVHECAAEVKPEPDDLCESAYKFFQCQDSKMAA